MKVFNHYQNVYQLNNKDMVNFRNKNVLKNTPIQRPWASKAYIDKELSNLKHVEKYEQNPAIMVD